MWPGPCSNRLAMRWMRVVVMLSVTACGSASTQDGGTPCPDGGDLLMCAAQLSMSPGAPKPDQQQAGPQPQPEPHPQAQQPPPPKPKDEGGKHHHHHHHHD